MGVLSNAGVPETLRLVGEETVSGADARLGAKMRHWKMGLRGSHVTSWLLDRRIDWGSSGFDPLINEAILVYRAFDSWEGTKRYMVDMLGNDTWKAAGQLMEFTYCRARGPHERLARGPQHPARRGVLPLPPPRAGRARRPGTATSGTSCWRRATRRWPSSSPDGGHGARPVRVDAARQLAPEPRGEVRAGRRRRLQRGPVDPRPHALPHASRRALHVERRVARGAELDGRRIQRRPGGGRGRGGRAGVVVELTPLRVVPAKSRSPAATSPDGAHKAM